MDDVKQLDRMIERIQRLISGKDVSLYKVAKESGIPNSNLYDLKNGRKKLENIPLSNAKKLLEFCDKYYR